MKKANIAMILLIALSFVIAIYFYPQMPEKMASHWNSQGAADDYMPKLWGLFLMPFVSIAILLMLLIIPKLDPLRANILKFGKYFDMFILLIIGFLFYIYALTIIWNLGTTFNMSTAVIPALAILFYYIGILMENSKRNWFVGIRTPWTLSSDSVWDKTHALGGKLFKLVAVISLLGLLTGKYAFLFLLIPIFSVVIITLVYSYIIYQKEAKK